ncbi:MAG: hypothetical protein U5N86_00865 [Planctomycetota bacterium]|nr:hypothetical protein [Planctomycetota bacterium]
MDTGNGTITNYSYNGLGRITAANGSPYTYDNNGNLLTKGSETFTYDWKNNLVRYQNSTTVEDVWLGYDIGNTLVAKGWTEEGGVTSSSSRSKLVRGKQAVLDGMPVFSRTTSTRTTNCFADLNNAYERFYIKSYNTSSMYNLMYEDTSQSTFTMLRYMPQWRTHSTAQEIRKNFSRFEVLRGSRTCPVCEGGSIEV